MTHSLIGASAVVSNRVAFKRRLQAERVVSGSGSDERVFARKPLAGLQLHMDLPIRAVLVGFSGNIVLDTASGDPVRLASLRNPGIEVLADLRPERRFFRSSWSPVRPAACLGAVDVEYRWQYPPSRPGRWIRGTTAVVPQGSDEDFGDLGLHRSRFRATDRFVGVRFVRRF